jgi:hypothetical protein
VIGFNGATAAKLYQRHVMPTLMGEITCGYCIHMTANTSP